MKNNRFLQSLICLLAVSCSVNELDMQVPDRSEKLVFHATLESSEPDTKVYLDNYLKILWNHDDRISIFNKSTLNQQFYFAGETGENSGDFFWVENDFFGAGNSLGYICAVYPYSESTSISNSNVLTLTLPEVQTYNHDNPKSFGQGANTMVSVTNDHLLRFKNVGGYLAFRFYGGSSEEPVTVSSIRLVGNNGENLSGVATMTPVIGEVPEIEWTSSTGKSILLDCGENGIELSTSQDDPTVFWMVVPPTVFSGGFTLLVTDTNGDVCIKKTTKPLEISRNSVLRISPVQVDMNSAGLSLNNVSSADPDKLPSTTAIDNRTFTVTMPTLDRSHLVLNYDCTEGASLMANGLAFEPGDPIDVTKPVTLTVYNGNYGKNYTIVGKNTGLPIVRITTTGFDLDQLEKYMNSLQNNDGKDGVTQLYGTDYRIWLPDDDGMVTLPDENGRLSGNKIKGSVSVRIEYADGTPGMKIDDKDTYEVATQIKGRGNYTWKWDKKPYALKLDKKGKVLGMPEHKRWVLLANWRDHTLLRNDATFELSRRAGLPYTVRGQFVELEFNGEYRGNYYLCEQIKIDKNRVNIKSLEDDFSDPSGGYLMEIDSYWDEINKFHSEYFTLNYMFKEPDEDPAAEGFDSRFQDGYTWMENHINEFEKVLKTKSAVAAKQYEQYLDVDSAIKFLLVNELSGNRDFFQNGTHSGPHSTYLYKDKGGKIVMGPGWDFDYETFIPYKWYDGRGYARSYSWRGFDKTGYYYYFLCANQDFVDEIKSIWNAKKSSFLGLTDYINTMVGKISLSQQFDEEKWPFHNEENRDDNHDYAGYSYEEAIDLMINSFTSKYNWMNSQINSLTTTSPSGYVDNRGRWHSGEWLFQ